MKINRDHQRLKDMVSAAKNALEFASGMRDEKTAFAVERCIEIMGEAANHVSASLKQHHGDVPWQDITGMRHKLIHEYAKIRRDIVWAVVDQELPRLIREIEIILKSMEKS